MKKENEEEHLSPELEQGIALLCAEINKQNKEVIPHSLELTKIFCKYADEHSLTGASGIMMLAQISAAVITVFNEQEHLEGLDFLEIMFRNVFNSSLNKFKGYVKELANNENNLNVN